MKFVRRFPRLTLFPAIMAISSASILIRGAQSYFDSIFIAASRLLVAGLFLLPFNWKIKIQEIKNLTKKTWILVFLSSFFLSMHFYSWIQSLEMTTVLTSVVLVTTTPIWVSLLSPFLLGEKITARFYLGLIIASVGIAVLIIGAGGDGGEIRIRIDSSLLLTSSKSNFLGNLLALIGAFCAAGYVICGKKIQESLSNNSYITLVYMMAGLICLGIFLVTDKSVFPFTPAPLDGWLILLLVAMIPQLLGHTLVNAVLTQLPAAHLSLGLLGEPIGSTILAVFFLGEVPGFIELIGASILIMGILIAIIKIE